MFKKEKEYLGRKNLDATAERGGGRIESSTSWRKHSSEYEGLRSSVYKPDQTVSLGGGTERSVRLLATSPVAKSILQGIASVIGDIISAVPGYTTWSIHGDPCVEGWEGVICLQDGTVIGIDFEQWYNDGSNEGFCAMGNQINGKRDTRERDVVLSRIIIEDTTCLIPFTSILPHPIKWM